MDFIVYYQALPHLLYYKVKFKDGSKKEYFFDDKWMPTTIRVEEIKVKGGRGMTPSYTVIN